jgi:hypothetical protein
MGELSYMVRADTEQACQDALDRLCAALGARPTILPTAGTGRGWIARAVPTTKAPAGGPGPNGAG